MSAARASAPWRGLLWRGLLWPGVFAALALAVLLSLGLWQLQRLSWKEELLARIAQRIDAPPADLPPRAQWQALALPQNEYTRVHVSGIFDHAREVLIFRAAGAEGPGAGFHVITPMRIALANGGQAHVLVNRGFVPDRLRDAMSRSTGQVEGAVRITGHIRAAETRSAFTPADTPEKGVWYTRDPRAMAAYLKLPDAAPFVIDADGPDNPGGWPKPGAARIRIPNNHLSYALTWFGLAATLLGVFAAFGWRRLRERG